MPEGRKLHDWLTAYLRYTENTEPPKAYHIWTGVSLVGGALQRKVHLTWGFETIYPNMYIVLVGPSGKCRKGTAMAIGRDLFKSLGLPMTSESITREALIRRMKAVYTTYQTDAGDIRCHCSLTCMSPELSVFLRQGDLGFLADLTDWYDSHELWTYETKNAGMDEIEGVCFNLLGATAADWLQSILPNEAIGGGFTSRIIFVVEDQKYKTIPKHVLTEEEKALRKDLIADLERIAALSGEFRLDPEAEAMYEAWYAEQDRRIAAGDPPISDPKFAGYCDRRATHIKKLAMICRASRSSSMIITAQDFERAEKLLLGVERNMPKVFSGIGTSPYSEIIDKVISFIEGVGSVSRSGLMMRFYRDMDSQTLEAVERSLKHMKIIKIRYVPDEDEIWYEFTG